MKDTSIIPDGMYCYTRKNGKRYICPYWSSIPERQYQENGYCSYLEKGDYELNREDKYKLIYPENHPDKGREMTAEEIGMPFSILWYMCKMCGINDDDSVTSTERK